MSTIKLLDEGGDPYTVVDFGTFRSSLYGRTVDVIRDINKRLPEFEFRDDDVLLISYPEAGGTWTFEILTMLMKGKAEGSDYEKEHVMLEASPPENMTDLLSPRLLNTHLPFKRLPKDIRDKKVKIVFVVRNPKDAAVSFYNVMTGVKHYEYEGKLSNWLPLYIRGDFAYESYFKFLRDYEEAIKSGKFDILVVHFEDLKSNTLSEVARLAVFLGLYHSEELISEIAEKCQLPKKKKLTEATRPQGIVYKGEKTFLQKGDVGNWKERLTVAENEMIDAAISEHLSGSMFDFKYE